LARCCFHELTVTAFNDPPVVRGEEGLKECGYNIRIALDSNLAWLPNDGVKVEVRQSVLLRQVFSEGALARARITEDEKFHCGLTPEFSGAGAAAFVRAQAVDRRPLE
jgi:hypothetical protein